MSVHVRACVSARVWVSVSECVLVCVCGYKAHTTYIFCILLKILIKYNTYTLTHSHTHITHTPITHTKHTHSHSHTHTQTHTQTHLSSVVNCVETNSTQFNADRCLFTSIQRLGSKKSIWRRIRRERRRIACLWWFMVNSHPFNPNSTQFDAWIYPQV